MKWDCGPDWEEEKARLSDWHPWFAWLPTRIASHDCRWLETVERKGYLLEAMGERFWSWEYRA